MIHKINKIKYLFVALIIFQKVKSQMNKTLVFSVFIKNDKNN